MVCLASLSFMYKTDSNVTIIWIFEILKDNIFVMFRGRVLQQTFSIHKRTKCAPFFLCRLWPHTDLFKVLIEVLRRSKLLILKFTVEMFMFAIITWLIYVSHMPLCRFCSLFRYMCMTFPEHLSCPRFLWEEFWRYQRGNHNPYIEEEQTTQWRKEAGLA